MLLRIRMFFLLRKLDALFSEHDDYLDERDLADILSDPGLKKALDALIRVKAVAADIGDDRIIALAPSPDRILYDLYRADLWWNRIVSFVLGVASTLIVYHFIGTLP